MDLEKAYYRVNMEPLWQVLRMYDVGGKYFNVIKSMYVSSKTTQSVYGCSDEISENEDGEEGSNISGLEEKGRILGLLYTEDFVFCVKSEEDLKVMMSHFVDVCRRRGPIINAGCEGGERDGT